MTFKPLPPRTSFGAQPSNQVTIRAGLANGRTNSTLSLPRAVLREAGLSDIPGEKLDILIGEGADEGSIALIPGSRSTLIKVSKTRVMINSAHLLAMPVSAEPCTYECGRKQLIIHLPLGLRLRERGAVRVVAA